MTVLSPTFIPVPGVTLDGAYDFGGAGVGRTITVDAGAVHLDNRQTTGEIQRIDVGAPIILTGLLDGLVLDLTTNVTPGANRVGGITLTMPAVYPSITSRGLRITGDGRTVDLATDDTGIAVTAGAAGDPALDILTGVTVNARVFGNGNTALGASVMFGTERFRVIGDARVEGIQLTKTHAAFAGSESTVRTGAVQTTTAAPTTVVAVTLADDTVYVAEVIVTARDVAGVDRATYRRAVRVHRQAAGVATLGTVQFVYEDETNAAWQVTFTVSGSDLRVTVIGDVGETVNWAATLTLQGVSGSV